MNFLILCSVFAYSLAAVEFLSEPRDTTTVVGGTAEMCCSYQGSSSNPTWRIDGVIYNWYGPLPRKHTFNITTKILLIKDVDVTLNGTEYQCLLPSIQSSVGTLYIIVEPYNRVNTSMQLKLEASSTFTTTKGYIYTPPPTHTHTHIQALNHISFISIIIITLKIVILNNNMINIVMIIIL